MHKFMRLSLFLPVLGFLLAGCEQLGIEDPNKIAAAREAEGRAIGSACRHSGRALEDCYMLNPRAMKAAIFTGWRDMDAYMRENNLESVEPLIYRADQSPKKKSAPSEETPAKKEGASSRAADSLPTVPPGNRKSS